MIRYSLQQEEVVFSASGKIIDKNAHVTGFEDNMVLCSNNSKYDNKKSNNGNISDKVIAKRSVPLPVIVSRTESEQEDHNQLENCEKANEKENNDSGNKDGEDKGEYVDNKGTGEDNVDKDVEGIEINEDIGENYEDEEIMPPYAKKEDCGGTTVYRCTAGMFCKKKFIRLQMLKEHVDVKHTERNFKCSKCEKKYFTKRHLQCHEKSGHKTKDHKCADCKVSFSSTLLMKAHIEVNHTVRTCSKCGFENSGQSFFNHRKNCLKKQVG